MTNSKILCVLMSLMFLIALSSSVLGQSPKTWFFGNKAGIYFGNTITTLNNNSISTPEGCGVLDGASNNVSLYCNGDQLWDGNGSIVPGCSNLDGSMNSSQSSIIYSPKNSDSVYVFVTDQYNGSKGLSYSTLSGVGPFNVISTNTPLLTDATEKITLTRHCDYKSQWLITHQWNTNAFYAYLIGDASFDPDPVVSNIGSIHNGNNINKKGCMKVSIDGDKIALVKMFDGILELFKFDNIHGEVSDPILISGIPDAYGVEFDKQGDIVYVSTASGQILQYSLLNWNYNDINSSKVVISNQPELLGSLQIGPDYKIYVSRDNALHLGRIESPYLIGLGCSYNTTAIYLAGNRCEAGLPQIFFTRNNYDFQGGKVCLGDTSFFELMGDTTRIDSAKWYFGDDPILDSAMGFTSNYLFTRKDVFEIKCIIYHCDTTDTLVNYQEILGPPHAYLGPDTSYCISDLLDLYPGLAEDYLWDDSSTFDTRSIITPGTYWVRITNQCGVDSDTVEIKDIFPLPIVILPDDTSICFGDSIIIDSGSDSNISIWQGTDTTRFYTLKQGGNYSLTVIDANSCMASDDINLDIIYPPKIDLGSDTTICIGKELIFNGSTQGHYLWQDGSNSSSMVVQEAGIYYVKVENECGEDTDTCEVIYTECNQIIWVPNAFTPNNDNKNEVFLPFIDNVDLYNLVIFNRWGEFIFESNSINYGWNGIYKGKNATEGVYTWRIKYTNFAGENFVKIGYVVLFR